MFCIVNENERVSDLYILIHQQLKQPDTFL